MKNNWYEIWNNRTTNFQNIDPNDEQKLIIELKRIVGWDAFGKGLSVAYEEIKKDYEYIRDNLKLQWGGGTVFEVGCGSGSNLYFFTKDGFKIGACDYAEQMINITKKVIGEENLIECICGDAAEISTDIKYDAVLATAVFQYLNSLEHAEKILDIMVAKSKYSIGLTRMFKEETKDEYINWRRATTENYDELYKNLPRLYISKNFLTTYAAKHNLHVTFPHHHIEGFWNEPFIFNCFMYKK